MAAVKNKVVVTSQAPAAKENAPAAKVKAPAAKVKAPAALVVQVGSTELRYHLRCIDDLHAMRRNTATGCHWEMQMNRNLRRLAPMKPGRAPQPIRSAVGYVPPVLEVLGLAEVEHNAKNNRMRAH